MFRIVFVFIMALIFAWPALATQTWTDCNSNTGGELVTVRGYNLICLDTDENPTDSRAFIVGTKTALICYDPNLADESDSTGTIKIRYCPNGKKPAANPQNSCLTLSTAALAGVQGDSDTQTACQRVGPGAYYIDFATDPGAGEFSRVTIQGEGD
jgi:hypothetical protein